MIKTGNRCWYRLQKCGGVHVGGLMWWYTVTALFHVRLISVPLTYTDAHAPPTACVGVNGCSLSLRCRCVGPMQRRALLFRSYLCKRGIKQEGGRERAKERI